VKKHWDFVTMYLGIERQGSLDMTDEISATEAKAEIFAYVKERGALAVGVADLNAIQRIAPAGHRPSDIMPRVKSVIALGVGGQTQGAWSVPAKAMAYFGSTETRAYSCAYGLSFFIESRFQTPSIYCPPDMDNEAGPRVPLQSLKLHAELAGIGARSLAGDILLHPEFGYMYFASVFTELELPPDEPMAQNPCPAPSCVDMYRKTGQTPCMKFCPVQCLSGKIDEQGKQTEMHYDMAACAEMSQQYEAVPALLAKAMAAEDSDERTDALFDPDNKMLWYKMSVGSGGLLAQCFECMRVCPIATRAPQADPIRRSQHKL
jgi:epoxyqueuosine reductase QueG